MKLLLDTHLLIWVLTDNPTISMKARAMINDPNNINYFSAISVWEVAIKHMARPDRIDFSGVRFAQRCRDAGFRPLDLSDRYVSALETLSRPDGAPPHKDPFDRMLIAQAKAEGMRFLTHDGLLSGYGEDCVVLV